MTLGPGKIVGFCFALAAALVFLVSIKNVRLAGRMLPVQGELKEISYQHARVGTSRASTYNVKARYLYSVSGTTYQGYLVSLKGNFYSSQKDADRIIRQLSAAGTVTVWYDPLDPSLAVLQKPGVEARNWIMLVALAVSGFVFYRYLDILVLALKEKGLK
ncbi:MAG: hypothetical protein A2075_13325 [Geobacteraceae bacterium GWC2_58_44]|nr:MAG: hypothetical protein A2075_13325 [Geobacteraceae bacterium GWC2_58_44]HBG08220.1 hypothetical protein [Geobacter sp.]